jgi:uncharacterized protein (DUF58 family)
MKLKPMTVVATSVGVILILVDLIGLKTQALWMLGLAITAFSLYRHQMRQMDAAREAEQQKELEAESRLRKKRGQAGYVVAQQLEQLRRDLETEQELDKLKKKRP